MRKAFLLISLLFMSLYVRPVVAETVVNKEALDFTLIDSAGKEIKLNEFFPDKSVVLWITNLCLGCQEGLPILQKFSKIYEEEIEFLAVVQPNIKTSEAQEIKNKFGVSFPFLMDLKGGVSKLYGGVDVIGICPLKNIFFIDRKVIIREVSHYPGLAEEEMERYLKLIL